MAEGPEIQVWGRPGARRCDRTTWSAGTWTLAPGLYTLSTVRNARTVTAQRAITIN
ncbi:hypothetical protein ACWEP8_28220 [Streptomyces hydrogenans]